MLSRTLSLALATIAVGGMLVDTALADHRKNGRGHAPRYYGPPEIFVGVPGLRLFFGDYALTPEEFDALYGRESEFDESYYEPEPVVPKPRKKPVSKAEKKVSPSIADEFSPEAADDQMTASIAPQSRAAANPTTGGRGLTCEKAGAVVRGYGFTDVTASSCSGKVYAFTATRDGKAFAIKLDPASGELTEVKKQP